MIAAVFLLALATSLGAYWLLAGRQAHRERSAAVRRLTGKKPAKAGARPASGPALIQMAHEVRGLLAVRLLDRLRLRQSAGRLLETAGLKWGAAGLAHRSAACFLIGFAAVTIPTGNAEPPLALAAAAAAGALPFLYVKRAAGSRLRKFEEQFPDCLEFIARSMRAGHAFSVSLDLVHRESSQPLAGELRRTFEEQNLGQPLEVALTKLGQRMPSMDVQFFVSAVQMQKRTGGNLAELLDRLAQLIRERFKLRARVRAISATGLMSGRVLAAIPAVVGALMFLVNPTYARFFVDDPVGHELLAGAVGLQLVGYWIICRIVTIEV